MNLYPFTLVLLAILVTAPSPGHSSPTGAAEHRSPPRHAALPEYPEQKAELLDGAALFENRGKLTGDAAPGPFKVVSVRNASGVAATLEMQNGEGRRSLIGTQVSFGRRLVWFDGRTCDDWKLERLSDHPLDMQDPNLSDLQQWPIRQLSGYGNRLQNKSYRIICDGQPFASLVKIDERVVVAPAPNGATHIIIERSPSKLEIRAMQDQLHYMGLYKRDMSSEDIDVYISGRMTQPLRSAIAAYAYKVGAEYAFHCGVVTENLLAGMLAAGRVANPDVQQAPSNPRPDAASGPVLP